MKTQWILPAVVASSLVLSGCFSSSSSSNRSSEPQSSVRVIHASPDAPMVNVLVNGAAALEGADYKQAGVLTPAPGSYEVAVEARLPDGTTTTVIGPVTLEFLQNKRYDVVAVGSAAGGTLERLILEDEASPTIGDGQVRLRVAHLAEAAGEVDVYLSDPAVTLDLANEVPDFTFDYKDVAGPLLVPAGSYQIQVTAAGSDTAVYDSGPVDLPAGADLLVSAVTNTGANAGASPISLLALSGGDLVADIFAVEQGAGVRVVHNSVDAPNVDVFVGGGELPAISDLAFTETAPEQFGFDSYVSLPAGTTNVQVTATGTTTAVIDADLALVNGQGLTVMAVNLLADIEPLVLEDAARAIATQATLRVVHGSTQAGPVDIYLVATGEGIGNSDPVLSGVVFKDVSAYLPVPQGTYDVIIATAGSGTPAVTVGPVELDNGRVYTAVARDQNGEAPAVSGELILLDDFTVTPTL
ncbi:MAG: DUF4397 domain-containing protein [Halomonadaceae bacterium]|nr:MAG: DUF4397 domain-containing protein [Halomonadaceae bacterium]